MSLSTVVEEFDAEVIASYGFDVHVINQFNSCFQCQSLQSLGRIIVGDWVIVQSTQEGYLISSVKKRKNLIARQISIKKAIGLASNIDQLLILIAPAPKSGQHFIDALLISACSQKIKPILVLNKCDTLEFKDWESELRKIYKNTPWKKFSISACQNKGLKELNKQLIGKKSLLVGQSGVGKSTLLNTLLSKKIARTQELSSHSNQGKHTTSNSISYNLANSKKQKVSDNHSRLIDTPGIREFNLINLDNIELGFPEMNGYFGTCRFRNCNHKQEIDCELTKAVAGQELNEKRLSSYLYFKRLALEYSKSQVHRILDNKI